MKAVRIPALLLTFAVIAAGPLAAQSQALLGLKGGINLANLSGTVDGSDLDGNNRTGGHGGVVVSYAFSRKFAIQGEALYVGKGIEPGGSVATDLDVNYVDFPVLGVLTFPIGESFFAPRVFAGPVFSWRTTCNIAEPVPPSGVTDCDLDVAKNLDIGVEFGASLKLGKGYGGFTLDVAYNLGLTNVSNTDGDTVRNRNLMFSLGYLFAIK
jgi:hypothetical protein